MVVVTINYRLSPLGCVAHPELSQESAEAVSGNSGILDQIAALKWVHRNVDKFGGNPDQVTIFCEFAGSWSVCVLVATSLAKGLFHRTIGQSGFWFGRGFYLKEDPVGLKTDRKTVIDFTRALGAESIAEP